MIIAVDFDGTIAVHKYPKVGEAMPLAFEVMKELQDAGHILVLNTCRENVGFDISKQYLTDAVEFCKKNGMVFAGNNATPKEHEFREEGGRKVYADLYLSSARKPLLFSK